ncbi:hypothetical protein PQE75_gp156 [Bacillus phage vB_BcoS-136]|uniref:PcfJ-like protein n=1 Tax=Bacillus phage vB_BcoS-136 TaxID=2419619 RepID=A0A3G3BVQ5_9CAUD|nr:hypothetical protein PQE75_gp156 [Bacillus phage vB_BcoS-136]AYP68323.1 hypothetical protein vBBcoS136_00209 [Bacillus phage vB_BcoS-136]
MRKVKIKVKKEDYKFGVIVNRGWRTSERYGICNCGQIILKPKVKDNQCDKCGNALFVDALKSDGRFSIPYLEILRKDNRGFKVVRANLSVIVSKDDMTVTPVQENLKRTMEYDIVDKVLKVWRNDRLEYDYSIHGGMYTDTNKLFFTQLDSSLFLEFVSNEVTRSMFVDTVLSLSNDGYGRKRKIMKGLYKLFDYQHLQILANAGIPNVDRFRSGGYYGRDAIDTTKKKPHEILRVPKFMIQYIREDVSINTHILKQIQNHLKNIDTNKLREILSIVKDEGTISDLSNSLDTIIELHVDYGYNNLKKLILYLFREVKLTQGIANAQSASSYLRDYARMSRWMELEWEKYPKSLKKLHDVVQMNYNVVNKNKDQQKEFKFSVSKDSYQNLIYYKPKKSKYAVIIPETAEDIIKEGNELSHCVASYVKDVIADRCKILFLREIDNMDKPLATIEVRGFNIRQARGYSNIAINQEQKDFIKEWAEEKNLVEAYY